MSTSIIGRIDEMGNRIDDLEKSIGDLMSQVRFNLDSF
jgi:heat shock factor-binding protein 1